MNKNLLMIRCRAKGPEANVYRGENKLEQTKFRADGQYSVLRLAEYSPI